MNIRNNSMAADAYRQMSANRAIHIKSGGDTVNYRYDSNKSNEAIVMSNSTSQAVHDGEIISKIDTSLTERATVDAVDVYITKEGRQRAVLAGMIDEPSLKTAEEPQAAQMTSGEAKELAKAMQNEILRQGQNAIDAQSNLTPDRVWQLLQ